MPARPVMTDADVEEVVRRLTQTKQGAAILAKLVASIESTGDIDRDTATAIRRYIGHRTSGKKWRKSGRGGNPRVMLLTQEIRRRLPPLYAQEKVRDPIVHAKFFTPDSNWTWYVTEGNPEGSDFRLFGLVVGHEAELGYFMLSDLEKAKGPMGLHIERDRHFPVGPLSKVRDDARRSNPRRRRA